MARTVQQQRRTCTASMHRSAVVQPWMRIRNRQEATVLLIDRMLPWHTTICHLPLRYMYQQSCRVNRFASTAAVARLQIPCAFPFGTFDRILKTKSTFILLKIPRVLLCDCLKKCGELLIKLCSTKYLCTRCCTDQRLESVARARADVSLAGLEFASLDVLVMRQLFLARAFPIDVCI